ncbi:MAG: hypothetical protein GOU97_00910 [Nanoarchaeota archaeon]|nr:hypothetical protein [Nanoarchaeota archaeon]
MELKTVMIMILIVMFVAMLVMLGIQYLGQAQEQGGKMNDLAFGLFGE